MSTAYTFLNLASMWEFCAKSGKASPALWDTYANDWVQTDFPAVIPQGRSFSQHYATVGTEIVTEFGGHLVMLASGLWYGDAGNMTLAQLNALPTAFLATGTRATAGASEVMWTGSEWVASYGGAVGTLYNGTTVPLPTPSALLLGMRIPVVNPAVPRGYSWLECNGAAWVPPRGEPIALKWRGSAAPIANVTPGVTTLTEIYGASGGSPVIPDYMLPDGLVFEASGWIAVYNASGASGCLVALGLSGSIMTGVAEYYYPHGAMITPVSTGLGAPYNTRGRGIVTGGLFKGAAGSGNGGGITNNTHGTFVSGANRAWAMAKPSGTADRIQLDGYSFVSEGNL